MSIKAVFLLFVFLLNTVTGFACAVGMNMDSGGYEHSDEHHHEHHGDEKENCCKDAVTKLTTSDKLTQRSFDFNQFSIPFILLPGIPHKEYLAISFLINVPSAQFSRHCRSPIRDLRVIIQSFQI